MRIFVWEYLCSGACLSPLAPSLATEGRSMLTALLADLSRLDGLELPSLWDRRLPDPPPLPQLVLAESPEHERQLFTQLVADCEATLLIAPEFGGLLAERSRMVEERGGRLLSSSSHAVELCGDKLQLALHLQNRGVPTIDTMAADLANLEWLARARFPMVVKPRDGAGSQATRLFQTVAELQAALPELRREPWLHSAIAQPYVPGLPLSVGLIFDQRGACRETLPVCEQILSTDGRFAYLGGRLPACCDRQWELQELARRACDGIPGLRGYVGVDLILPADSKLPPVVVEINPRLTTSYLGYRARTAENLAARIAGFESVGAIRWHSGRVAFLPEGQVCEIRELKTSEEAG